MDSGRWMSALAVLLAVAVGAPGQDRLEMPSVQPVSASEPAPPRMRDVTPPELSHEHGSHGQGSHGSTELLTGCCFGNPKVSDAPGQFFASGEFLIWRPRLDSLDYALLDPNNDLTPQGRLQSMRYESRGGLRVGMGYRLPGKGWDIGLTYTYFRSSGDAASAAPAGGVLYPSLTRPGLIDRVSTASITGGLDYSVFDLDVGRTWEVDSQMTLRTFGGVRFASIDLDQTASYDGIHASMAQVNNRSAFDGVGPTAGLEARWTLTPAIAVFGNARGGLLFGDFAGSTRETNGGGLAVNSDIADEYSGVTPFASVALGGSYTWRTLTFAAGYEITHYFNAVTRPVLTDDFAEGKVLRRRSDLSFDGVFFRLGIAY